MKSVRLAGSFPRGEERNEPIQLDLCALYPMLQTTSTAHVVSP